MRVKQPLGTSPKNDARVEEKYSVSCQLSRFFYIELALLPRHRISTNLGINNNST
jgi:hypothetical protein